MTSENNPLTQISYLDTDPRRRKLTFAATSSIPCVHSSYEPLPLISSMIVILLLLLLSFLIHLIRYLILSSSFYFPLCYIPINEISSGNICLNQLAFISLIWFNNVFPLSFPTILLCFLLRVHISSPLEINPYSAPLQISSTIFTASEKSNNI